MEGGGIVMTDFAQRGPLGLKATKGTTREVKPRRVKPISDKRAAYWRSPRGKAALAYIAEVKQLPCVACGRHGPSDAHHPICERYGGRKSDDFEVIPLCKACHQDGPRAIHTDKTAWMQRNGSDRGYIERTRSQVLKKMWEDWI